MKVWTGLLATGAAAAGFLLFTDRGKQLTHRAADQVRGGVDRLKSFRGGDGRGAHDTEEVVQDVLSQPHPDTAVARAFEEAVA